jgi:hypothetical protein
MGERKEKIKLGGEKDLDPRFYIKMVKQLIDSWKEIY